MAAPTKSALDYFPFDTHLDDKFELIEAQFGLKGFSVIVKLYQKIYGGAGYYCEWTKDIALLFANRMGLNVNVVSDIVGAAIKRGIFDAGIFEKYHVLTSKGIQKRYFEAVSRRKNLKVKPEYLLIQLGQKQDSADQNGVNVNINRENDSNNRQKKREEIKGKDIKGNETKQKNEFQQPQPDIELISNEYESCIGAVKGYITEAIEKWMEIYSKDVIIWAIHEAALNNAGSWQYVNAILTNHHKEGRRTLDEIKSASERYKRKRFTDKDTSVYKSDGTDYDEIERLMNEKY